MREKYYKINSAGQEFDVVLGNKVIEIYYNDKEVSKYLQRAFVPANNETFSQLEERIDQAIENKNILLRKKKYEEIPSNLSDRFEEEFGVNVSKTTVLKDLKLGKFFLSFTGGNASEDLKYRDVYIISLLNKNSYKSFSKEAYSVIMIANPYTKSEIDKKLLWRLGDIIPFPLIYSPLDKVEVFVEKLSHEMVDYKKIFHPTFTPTLPHPFDFYTIFITGFTTSIVGGYVVAIYIANFVLGSRAIKIPRSINNNILAHKYKKSIDKLKENYNKKEITKLLMVINPDDLLKMNKTVLS